MNAETDDQPSKPLIANCPICAISILSNEEREQLNMDIVERRYVCLVPDCGNVGSHEAPDGSEGQRLCCKHLEQFIAHLMDPLHNLTFPQEAGDGLN
jgi:hypothetical protein